MKARRYLMKKHRFREGRSLFYEELQAHQKRRASERDLKVQGLEMEIEKLKRDITRIKREIGIQ